MSLLCFAQAAVAVAEVDRSAWTVRSEAQFVCITKSSQSPINAHILLSMLLCCTKCCHHCRLQEQPRPHQHLCQLQHQALLVLESNQSQALQQGRQQPPAQAQGSLQGRLTESLEAAGALGVGGMAMLLGRLSWMMTGKRILMMRLTTSVSIWSARKCVLSAWPVVISTACVYCSH